LQRLAEYLESEPQRLAAKADAQKAKLEALERKLGIDSSDPSGSKSDKKHRLDDTEYLEQSKEIVDGVKIAVSVAMLKKRKRAKTDGSGNGSKKPEPEAKTMKPAAMDAVVNAEAPAVPVAVTAAVNAEAPAAPVAEAPLGAVGA